jgi:hypothetical protein
LLIWRWYKIHRTFPRIFHPVTFSEKILHRSLFDHRPQLRQIADKAAVRSYVESRVGSKVLTQLYHLTDNPETIPFDDLPNKFVVKPTHGSGWVRLIHDKSKLDRAGLIQLCRDWLARSFYEESREHPYKHVKPRILVEEFIDDRSGFAPIDYKMFVFGGTVELIQVDVDRFGDLRERLYLPTWEKANARFEFDDIIGELPPPAHLAEMIAAAEKLGAGWDFIRADFYDTGDRIYFGELTMTPGRGCLRIHPKEFNHYLGTLWKIRDEAGDPLSGPILAADLHPFDRAVQPNAPGSGKSQRAESISTPASSKSITSSNGTPAPVSGAAIPGKSGGAAEGLTKERRST